MVAVILQFLQRRVNTCWQLIV